MQWAIFASVSILETGQPLLILTDSADSLTYVSGLVIPCFPSLDITTEHEFIILTHFATTPLDSQIRQAEF